MLERPRPPRGWRPGVVLIAALALAASSTAATRDQTRPFITRAFGFSPAEIDQVDRGHVVARTLGVPHSQEIATIGLVRLRMTPDFYIERLRDIVRFKQSPEVLQIGRFSATPHADDLAGLTLDPADVDDLRGCRVGDCGLQLSAPAIERARRSVNWRGREAAQQANQVMRAILADYAAAYWQGGDMASPTYADEASAVHVGQAFRAFSDAAIAAWTPFHVLHQHLHAFPARTPAITDDILYWSKEKVGRRTVASITHLAVARTEAGPAAYAVASKQIYATHYYHASLGLTVLVDRTEAAPATYVVYVNRSRIDVLGGLLGGVTRRIISSRARATVADHLAMLQQRLEPDFAARSTP
jgi:hypothetical protein